MGGAGKERLGDAAGVPTRARARCAGRRRVSAKTPRRGSIVYASQLGATQDMQSEARVSASVPWSRVAHPPLSRVSKNMSRSRTSRPLLLAAVVAIAAASLTTATTSSSAPTDDVQELRPGDGLRGELIRLDEETKWCVLVVGGGGRRLALRGGGGGARGLPDTPRAPSQPISLSRASQTHTKHTRTNNRYQPVGLVPGARYEVSVSYPASLPAAVDVRVVERRRRRRRQEREEEREEEEEEEEEEDGGGGAPEEEQQQKRRRRRRGSLRRRLLDLEKASFRAAMAPGGELALPGASGGGAGGGAEEGGAAAEVLVAVRARRRSPRAPAAGPGPDLLPYNVRLCRAYLPGGVLPAAALAPGLALVALLLLLLLAAAAVGRGAGGGAVRGPGLQALGFAALLDWIVAGGGAAGGGKKARGGGGGGGGRGGGAAAAAAAAGAPAPTSRARAAARGGGGGG